MPKYKTLEGYKTPEGTKTKPKVLKGSQILKRQQVLGELTQAQAEELRAIDARLQEVLEERRAGSETSRGKDETFRRNVSTEPTEHQVGSITFRYETVRCGKENCSRCPHGPYWYAYWKEGGRTRSRYIGRSLPAPALQSYEDKRRARLEKA